MSQQLGPTYLLSVLVVLGCAIAFYRPEKLAPPPMPRVAQGRGEGTKPPDEDRPAVPKAEPARARLVAEARVAPAPAPVAAPTASRPEPPAARVVTPASRPISRAPTAPRGAFARAEEGETLKDVALRVYGTPDKAETLWRANRDQLRTPDSALAAGMLLRTP